MASFKIGINMAGAVSAGAYTAGVLDFLTEALDEWYGAKARGERVPTHDVSIEVFSGASAGGMCAAISAVMLQENFEHIHDTSKRQTDNRFYESWVNKIDIVELLKTDDLHQAPLVVSLLDSTIIDQIAKYALTAGNPLSAPRPYVSPNLTLFLSLTNLRGIPYSLNGAAPGSIEETTFFYGDRIRFETVRTDTTPSLSAPLLPGRAHPLDLTGRGTGGWDLLQSAAMATGAFPVFLAPRVLTRNVREYTPPMWESVTSAVTEMPPTVPPNFPADLHDPFDTLNVDGGVTNNDPFNFAHDYLASLSPPSRSGQIASDAVDADRAVISIAPFPTTERFDLDFDLTKNSAIFSALPRLFSALVSQSRFFGESLSEIMTGTTFSRFVIAPSEDERFAQYKAGAPPSSTDQTPALQCATLGAFGGFFERGFRAHDYQLGRRNCQKFLRDRFVLPVDNVILKPALQALDPAIRESVLSRFKRPAPGTYANSGETSQQSDASVSDDWLPIIPLCSPIVSEPIPAVEHCQMDGARLKLIVTLILRRFRAVVFLSLRQIPFWPLRVFLRVGQPFITFLARRPLTAALIKQLGESYRP